MPRNATPARRRPLHRRRLPLVLAPLVFAACAAPMVHTDVPAAFPVDLSAIDRALVGEVSVTEGYAYEVWTSDMYPLIDGVSDQMKLEGRLGTAVVLLTADDVGCDELSGGAPPAGTAGLVLAYHWWTSAAEDPSWEGGYGTDAAVVEGEVVRMGAVGTWDDGGPWRLDPVPGRLDLDTWGSPVSGGAALSVLDAAFTAERCGEGA